ncbi:glyoxalase [Pseudoclavibacter sp. AY1F1]|uniref:VOC family protein n=1 Tax=Pseudoclavibacter sp. AY1F1 TaxID=2080583 RepID=UPI000CE7BCA4|nr:VOC family protein [Pseudoclavibacter sp. AY1F1]PPF44396.1 glyoxalase [Pseudoclavibacter sp. AY1F1]
MKIRRTVVVLDAADIEAESAFWASLLEGTVEKDDDWHSIYADGEWRLGIQLAPDHVPPRWPDGQPQQQMHLDLYIDDLDEGHRRVLELGGRLLKASDRPDSPEDFVVYADPAGHPFCLCKSPQG